MPVAEKFQWLSAVHVTSKKTESAVNDVLRGPPEGCCSLRSVAGGRGGGVYAEA
jgi:hypothetical protein